MTLERIAALQNMSYPELANVAHSLQLRERFATADGLRLAIIDAIVEQELQAQRDERTKAAERHSK